MQIVRLNKPYISVENSFGGNQEWFEKTGRPWKGRAIKGYGCGLIGASDVLLHILDNLPLQTAEKLEGNKGIDSKNLISKTDYIDFIRNMERRYFHIFPKLGLSGILLALGMNLYFMIHRKEIKRLTGHKYRARWAVWPSKLLDRIKEMLESDLPVIISIGPGFFHKDKVRFYVEESVNNKSNSNGQFKTTDKTTDRKEKRYKVATSTRDHYVTITGIIESKEDNITLLEISSWGKKYYIRYDEYRNFVKKCDNFYFSNILYIKAY